MNASTPWWVTVLIAFLGLVGVLCAQWLTARRDVAERRDRLRADRAAHYMGFQRTMSELTAMILNDDHVAFRATQLDFMNVVLLIVTTGSARLGPSLDDLSCELGRINQHWPADDEARDDAVKCIGRHLALATTLMRFDATDVRVPRLLRFAHALRHPFGTLDATGKRWGGHWSVLDAELEQPVWPPPAAPTTSPQPRRTPRKGRKAPPPHPQEVAGTPSPPGA